MKKIITLLTALFLVSNVYGQTENEYVYQGNAKGRLQDYRGAIADYNKAIKLNPNDAKAYNNRGVAKGRLQDYRGAIADFTKAIELNPNLVEAYNNRGIAKGELQDYRGAIADFTKAIKLNPNHAMAYYNRGLSKVRLGQRDSACLDFSKAGELGYGDAYESIKKHCNYNYLEGFANGVRTVRPLTITGTKNTHNVPIRSVTHNASNVAYSKPKKTAPIIYNTPQSSPHNNTTSSVIGTPIKVGKLEIAEHDFPTQMTWSEAKRACAALGNGWRLPTKEELNELYIHKDEIGGFANVGFANAEYWSSSENTSTGTRYQNFYDGFQGLDDENNTDYVRAVRSLTITGTKNTHNVPIRSVTHNASNVAYSKPKKTAPIIYNTPQSSPHNNTTSSIIGTPIKVGKLEIAQHDFPTQMTWSEAKSACAALGNGWRLPTKEELHELYIHRVEIGGFANADYWSSSENTFNAVSIRLFYNGFNDYSLKNYTYFVRAVRVYK
jgi:hypothetical protein